MAILDGTIPHFNLPFKMSAQSGGISAAVVEQDTLDDVTNCVEMALRYRHTERILIPDFGIEDPVFEVHPIDTEAIIAQVLRHEPRASLLMDQQPDETDLLITSILTEVSSLRRTTDA